MYIRFDGEIMCHISSKKNNSFVDLILELVCLYVLIEMGGGDGMGASWRWEDRHKREASGDDSIFDKF